MSMPTGSNPSLKGTGYREARVQQFTPEQMQLFQQMFSQVGPNSYFGRLAGGDQSAFNDIEAPVLRQFGELQGNIASRFSGMGTGARKSSGFQNTLNGEAGALSERLAANRHALQRQAIMDMSSLSNELLNQRPYETFLTPEKKKQSLWQKIVGVGLPTIGGAAGGYFGGPQGAVAGVNIGNSLANAITGEKGGGPTDWGGISRLPTKWGT